MNSGIKSTLGKTDFLIQYPLLWATFVFIGTELVLWLFNFSKDLSEFDAHPLLSIGTLLIKYFVFVAIAYSFSFYKKNKARRQ